MPRTDQRGEALAGRRQCCRQTPPSPLASSALAERWRAATSSRTIPRARMTASHAAVDHLAVARAR